MIPEWTPEMVERLVRLRAQGLSAAQIAARLNHEWGTDISKSAILSVWSRKHKAGEIEHSFRAAGPYGANFHSLLDGDTDVHRCPTAAVSKMEKATAASVTKCTHLSASIDDSTPPESGWSVFGLWADLHVGSKFTDYDGIRSVQAYGARAGVTDWFCAGDWCDGSYSSRGGEHEQIYVGLDSQVSATLDLLDQRPGVRHHIIDGNHEHRYFVRGGTRSGDHLAQSGHACGRSDIFAHGYVVAQVKVQGVTVEMVHYARGVESAPEKWLADRPDSDLPDVLVGGHYHIHSQKVVRGVECIQPGSFQESDFMRGSRPHRIGAVIIYVQHLHNGQKRYLTEFVRSGQKFG